MWWDGQREEQKREKESEEERRKEERTRLNEVFDIPSNGRASSAYVTARLAGSHSLLLAIALYAIVTGDGWMGDILR